MPPASTPAPCRVAEHRILVAAFQCFEELPKINYEKLAKQMNWTLGTAQSNWSKTKTAILKEVASGGGEANGKGKSKGAKGEDEAKDDRNDSASPAPAAPLKKKRGRKPKANPTSKGLGSDNDEDDDNLESVIPPRPLKRARKPKEEVKYQAQGKKSAVGQELFEEGTGDRVEVKVEDGEVGAADDGEDEIGDAFLAELNAYAERQDSV